MITAHQFHGLYAIADSYILSDSIIVKAVEQAIAGGANTIQYRDKFQESPIPYDTVCKLCSLCHQHGLVFIVNDNVSLARTVGADGVHLGNQDMPISQARSELGDKAIIGISCYNDFEQARKAVIAGADYIAFGSFYPSVSKPKAVRARPELLTRAKKEFGLPVVAIGGITPENGAELIAAGADALAVISGVFASTNIRQAAEQYHRLFITDDTDITLNS